MIGALIILGIIVILVIICVSADSLITVDEAEMLRAIADSLDCPIPPFIPKTTEGIGIRT